VTSARELLVRVNNTAPTHTCSLRANTSTNLQNVLHLAINLTARCKYPTIESDAAMWSANGQGRMPHWRRPRAWILVKKPLKQTLKCCGPDRSVSSRTFVAPLLERSIWPSPRARRRRRCRLRRHYDATGPPHPSNLDGSSGLRYASAAASPTCLPSVLFSQVLLQ
jgi:hypothetical protein